MPLLVVYSRFSRDSQVLRRTAQQLGWETLRLDGRELPDWVNAAEPDVAIFATMPEAQSIADQLARTLLGCGADWLPRLPYLFRQREMEVTTFADALTRPAGKFIKSAITKHLAGKLWTPEELRQESQRRHPGLAVLVAEPIEFLVEYRCFVANREVAAISPYRRFDKNFDESAPSMHEPADERAAALNFARTVLNSEHVESPPAFVLDVGLVNDRGWAVVEANECWASGIYHCDPGQVLRTLQQACIPAEPRTDVHKRWDFAAHYAAAVPN